MSYATVNDVELRWRPLSEQESAVAAVLIEDAEDIIRGRCADLDARVTSGDLRPGTVIRVVAAMVRRAMLNRDGEGVEQRTMTAGPFGDSARYVNPNNNLYLSADEAAALEPVTSAKGSRVGWLA